MVQRGEVYYIVDQEYDNETKNYATTKDAKGRVIKDNTIKGSRPWIIIGINGRTVTVLPLTSKAPNNKDLSYKIYDLKHNKTSYVLLTQPKTVNISELGSIVFKTKVTTVDNIVDKMTENFKSNKKYKTLIDYVAESSLAKFMNDDNMFSNWRYEGR